MEDICECPKCGRMHRNLGFGKPPNSGPSIEAIRAAIADGFNNGYQQYDECDAMMKMRFDAAARAVLEIMPK